jgi:hypothetical protein
LVGASAWTSASVAASAGPRRWSSRRAGAEQVVDLLAARLIAERHRGPVEHLARSAVQTTRSLPALKAYLDGDLEREDAASRIGENYLRFVRIYSEARETADVNR